MFGFVPLPWPLLATMVLIVVGYIVATEVVKNRYFAANRS